MQLYDYSTGGIAAHKAYNKANPSKQLTKSEHRDIISCINEEISDYLINTGNPFKLGHGLGELQIKKKFPAPPMLNEDGTFRIRIPIDWAATNKLWKENPEAKENKKLIRHLNSHTNGFTAKLTWSNTKYMALYECWDFEAGRDFNRKLGKILKTVPDSIDRYLNVK